ncbi:molybdenum cofactor guanylyltransferase MobA [Sulfurimonas sp.]|jgi:molybdenum cofactor guanylyltransferase|uniref:molybdenum cofactor guanylyltransferase MobA n=1 Tax=Sulfurimonas sp. TaxID=2022749 RepID=UPI0025FCC1CF|nr:molybdenum cofactor guanylyltransferase MobA [Sulfurimonas sp.]MBT5935354.1 molybdenum cofactor guanylyltransferase MobA [Sulfurimonas sp.]
MIDIPCVIFAGGKSSRMGEDKALLSFGNFKTLTEFQLSRLSKIFSNVYISCKDQNKFDFQANFLEDDKNISTFAPTAGFISAFKHLKEEKFFAISVDSPFINFDVIQKLFNADNSNNDATIAKTQQGIQPLCGIYHRSLDVKFQEMHQNENHKLGFLLKNSRTEYVEYLDNQTFLNLNNLEDYKEALSLL